MWPAVAGPASSRWPPLPSRTAWLRMQRSHEVSSVWVAHDLLTEARWVQEAGHPSHPATPNDSFVSLLLRALKPGMLIQRKAVCSR